MLTNSAENGRTIAIPAGPHDHHNAVELDRAASALINLGLSVLGQGDFSGEVLVEVYFRNNKITGHDERYHAKRKPLGG